MKAAAAAPTKALTGPGRPAGARLGISGRTPSGRQAAITAKPTRLATAPATLQKTTAFSREAVEPREPARGHSVSMTTKEAQVQASAKLPWAISPTYSRRNSTAASLGAGRLRFRYGRTR